MLGLKDSLMRSVTATSQYRTLSKPLLEAMSMPPLKNANTEAQLHVKMFYAQRNLYLTGFTLFLALYGALRA